MLLLITVVPRALLLEQVLIGSEQIFQPQGAQSGTKAKGLLAG